MSLRFYLKYYSRWILISATAGVLCGLASAFFLLALEFVTAYREGHQWLLYLLPLGGLLVGALYHYYGRSVEGGNNLIIEEFHDPKAVIPFRMAPLVLLGTMITHFFGGSAGREGTAVQMGGSIADQLTKLFKCGPDERRTLLMAGMSGGFGSVFGVPFAGTIFGLEVLAVGRLNLWALVECAISAFVAHYTTLACGVHHTPYPSPTIPAYTFNTFAVVLFSGVVFGAAARLFAVASHGIGRFAKSRVKYLPLRAALGGVILSLLYFGVPVLKRYAGLGVPIILSSLQAPQPLYDWAGKLGMTALTLGLGFKGGEVTPLLFVGSTLGNALASFLPFALPALGSIGLVAVFAGAANTPLACTVMAMELFGPGLGFYAALACFASYAVSGHHGIYTSQRSHVSKHAYRDHVSDFWKTLFKRPRV